MVNLITKKKPLPGIIHFAGWGLVFALPFFFTGHEQDALTTERYLRWIIPPISFMVIFYVNYFLLVDRYLFSRRTGLFILINLLMIIVAFGSVDMAMRTITYFYPHPDWRPRHLHSAQNLIMFIMSNLTFYMLVAGMSVAIKMTNGWYEMESMRKELERSRAEAELQNLKSQLNPHFLFNTLNNIYSLIAFSPEQAQDAVHDLSRLLRYVLYESSQPQVPLEKDLNFLRNYIELMRIRLSEEVTLHTDIQPDTHGLRIAPLLFISLVENAFKHGVSNSRPSFISIDIHEEGDQVVCEIHNSFFPKDPNLDKSGSGIGLVNLRKRLDLLYPDQYSFEQGRQEDKYHTRLTIQIKPQDV